MKSADPAGMSRASTFIQRRRLARIIAALAADVGAETVACVGAPDPELTRLLNARDLQAIQIPPDDLLNGNLFDLIVGVGLLETQSINGVAHLLAALDRAAKNAVYISSITFSDELDHRGDNVHRTIRPASYWQSAIAHAHGCAAEFPVPQDFVHGFVSWSLSERTRSTLRRIRRIATARKLMRARLDRPLRKLLLKRGGRIDEAELFAAVRNKSVALIGNATGLVNDDHGAQIDAHDLVVRLNRAPIITAASHGTRTDWIATSKDMSPLVIANRSVDLVIWATPSTTAMPLWLARLRPLHLLSTRRAEALQSEVARRPSAGAYVVDLLAASPCSNLTIYGFDGMKSRSLANFRPLDSLAHDFGREQEWLAKLAESDDKIVVVPITTREAA